MNNTTIAQQLPINNLLSHTNYNFKDFKDELNRKIIPEDDQSDKYYHIDMKETDDLCILYYNDITNSFDGKDESLISLEKSCRSIIMDKSNLGIIGSQFNRIIYNDEGVEFIMKNNWDRLSIQRCYEGTILLVFNHNGEWYVSTRRCLRSEESSWVKGKSYREMFDEAVKDDFSFDNLNPNYCYHFVLVHHKNKNIVNYSGIGNEYKEIYHILTTEKYTLNEVQSVVPGVNMVEEEPFPNIESLMNDLNEISQYNEFQHKIGTEGYVIRVYDSGDKYKSPFTIVKLQTDIYQRLNKIKPNNNNIHQSYLELYQKNNLIEFLPYFSKYSTELVKRIHTSMKNMAKEALDLYHCTRQKKNDDLYSNLTDQYKKLLYGLHGLYITQRRGDFKNGKPDTNKISKSINVHDVYHHLKGLPPNELRQLYYERTKLIENSANTFINKDCIYTKTQCTLMFNILLA